MSPHRQTTALEHPPGCFDESRPTAVPAGRLTAPRHGAAEAGRTKPAGGALPVFPGAGSVVSACSLALALFCLILLPARRAPAATSTWDGTGGNVNWSTGGNWGGSAPTSSTATDLIFAGTNNVGTSGTPLNQNIASPMLLNSLTFNSGGGPFFLGGSALRFQAASNTITQNSSSAVSIANDINAPSSNSSFAISLTGDGRGIVTLGGVIASGSGQRDYALVKSGSSTFALGGANTYGGDTTINGGVLLLTNVNALPNRLIMNGGVLGLGAADYTRVLGTGANQVSFAGSGGFAAYGADRNVNLGGAGGTITWGSGSFVATGSAFILGASSADKTVTFQNSIAFGAVTRTVQVDDGAATVDGVLSGVLSGTGGLTKTGYGALTLSNANTFSGITTINAGILSATVNSALGSTTKVTVNTGGTLLLGGAGTNKIGDTTEIDLAGGTVNTGGLTEVVGKLTLSSHSTLDFGSGASIFTFDGASSLGVGTLVVLNWTGVIGSIGGTDRLLFDNSSFVAGTTTNQILFDIGGIYYTADFKTVDGNTVEAVAGLAIVPEPSTIFAVSLLGMLIGWRERHRLSGLLSGMVLREVHA
ncbi:MAG: hypothetical protein QOE70_6685 [Chthoniobacter sp.]|jgi:autotransporter-associated beta strand protein|nr:hypothetical protein [Chthoniobacter sp.]